MRAFPIRFAVSLVLIAVFWFVAGWQFGVRSYARQLTELREDHAWDLLVVQNKWDKLQNESDIAMCRVEFLESHIGEIEEERRRLIPEIQLLQVHSQDHAARLSAIESSKKTIPAPQHPEERIGGGYRGGKFTYIYQGRR